MENLGKLGKDIISGFEGIIMSKEISLMGRDRYGILPQKLDKDGKEPDWEWFDVARIEIIGDGITYREDIKERLNVLRCRNSK